VPARSPDAPGPGALVVGAAKCGTTTVHDWLARRADVWVPPGRKEIGWFAPGASSDVRSLEGYLALFDAPEARGRLRVDVSTSYLYPESTPGAIRGALGPDVRIVVLLRDPVRMAFSLWQHMVRDGGEPLGFAAALAAEGGRLHDPRFRAEAQGWHMNYYYAARASYAPQVERYLATFGRERVRVFVFEEFFAPGWPELGALCDFLGIARPDAGGAPRRANVGGTIRSPRLRAWLGRRTPLKSLVGRALGPELKRRNRQRLNDLNTRPYTPSASDVAACAALRARLAPDVRALERLLGRDLRRHWPADAG
jgi:hypothetical protein